MCPNEWSISWDTPQPLSLPYSASRDTGFESQISAKIWTNVIILICQTGASLPHLMQVVSARCLDARLKTRMGSSSIGCSHFCSLVEGEWTGPTHIISYEWSRVRDTPPPSSSWELEVNCCQKSFLTKSYVSLFCEMYFSPLASGNMHHLISQIDFQFSPIISLSNIWGPASLGGFCRHRGPH